VPVSTAFTLVLIPVVYWMIHRKKHEAAASEEPGTWRSRLAWLPVRCRQSRYALLIPSGHWRGVCYLGGVEEGERHGRIEPGDTHD